MKKKIASGLAASLVMLILGGAWHMGIMSSFYKMYAPSTAPANPNILIIAAGYLVLGFLMVHLYTMFENKTISTGLILGIIAGILWVTPHGIIMIAANGIPSHFILVDGLWHVVEEGIGGLVLALVYSKVS